MKRLYTLIMIAFVSSSANAQSPNWLWANGIGGTNDDQCYSIATDDSGNIYTTGYFQGTVDFDPGAGTFTLTAAGGTNIFISKSDNAGNFVWAKAFLGASCQGRGIAIDASLNIYITGFFAGTVDFDPGAATFNLTSPGSSYIFISKLDGSGNFIWAKAMSGTDNARGLSVTVNQAGSGDVYTTGWFSGTTDFNPDTGTFNLMATGGVHDIFISKLDSAGNFAWAKAIGGTSYDIGKAITLDPFGSGEVYSTGYFRGTVDFDPGAGVFNLTSAGLENIFISKLDSSGNFVWAKAINGSGIYDNGQSIAIDPSGSGSVYITGNFSQTADFDPGAGTYNLTAAGISNQDIFISKLDNSGNFVWAKQLGGTGDDYGYSIDLDAFGNVYTTGNYFGTADFDPGAAVFNLVSTAPQDIFVSKLNSAGNFVWAKGVDGQLDNDYSQSIAVNDSGSVLVAGYFYSSSLSFGSTTLTNVSTGSYADLFIARIDTAIVSGINNEENSGSNFLLFPNPTSNQITFELSGNNKIAEVIIRDVTGKVIYATSITGTPLLDINIKDFSSGIYFVQVKSKDFVETKKLIIQNMF